MRATIDVGIDLGTTNSAVAVRAGRSVEVVKGDDGREFTPSAVQLLAGGGVVVGARAYENHRTRGEADAAVGFKRQMGKQDQLYTFEAAGVTRTPEELSAEILKSLRAYAETLMNEPLHAAVITVPAAFELTQGEATERAARRAGIEIAPVLQEPIAAGLAYGYQHEPENGYFMVYDLGGGTFDVSLMQLRDNWLDVVEHAGDLLLGGRDWDRRLAELLFERLAAEGYAIWPLDDPRGLESRRVMERRAEEEKIRLSLHEQVEVVFDGSHLDAEGRPIHTSIVVTRAAYEALIEADIRDSIALARRVLESAALAPSAVSRLVTVGAPTLTPKLRRMLTESLAIPLDTRIDPMTVVARGAALFAGSQPLERPANATLPPDVLGLKLSYAPDSDDTEVRVGGQLRAATGPGFAIELRREDGGWTSARLPLDAGKFRTTVVLAPQQMSVFEVHLYDPRGGRVATDPDRLAITHGIRVQPAPLSKSISVLALDEDGREELVRMLDRGKVLPAVRERVFKTARALRPGDKTDALQIHVVEGELARWDLNAHVGWLSVTGADVPAELPARSDIRVTIRVDASRGIVATAFIERFDLTVENVLQGKYRPRVDVEDLEADLVGELERAREAAALRPQEVARIEQTAHGIARGIAAARGGERDAADRADADLRELKAAVDRLDAETRPTRLAGLLEAALEHLSEAVRHHGGAEERTQLELLKTHAERAIAAADGDRMELLRRDVAAVYWPLVQNDIGVWVRNFSGLSEAVERFSRKLEAGPFLRRGQDAMDRQDVAALRAAAIELDRMLLPKEKTGLPIGLLTL